MLIRRLNPFGPFEHLRREIDRLFDGHESSFSPGTSIYQKRFPALNIWEDDKNVYAEAEIPGVNREDVEIYTVGNELTIKGKRQALAGENVSYHRQERGVGEFTRVVTLPVEVDADKVEAGLKDGVLIVTMPKAQEVLPKKITIKAD